jgi:hypothetical protein
MVESVRIFPKRVMLAATGQARWRGSEQMLAPHSDVVKGVDELQESAVKRGLQRIDGDALQKQVEGDLPHWEFGQRPTPKTLDEDASHALRGRVHESLGDVVGPLTDDLVTELQKLHDVPVSELPRAGAEPHFGKYAPVPRRWAEWRFDVGGSRKLFTRLDHKVESEQVIPGSRHMSGADIVVPVGEHGEPMARALANASRVIDAVILEKLGPHTDALTNGYSRVLTDWTFRKNTLHALMEGIGTFSGTTGILTHKKVAGLDGVQLLQKIEDDRLLERAAKGPLAMAGPMFFRGYVPKTPVALNDAGKLKPSAEYVAIEKATREKKKGWMIRPSQTRTTHRGCPIAVRNRSAEAGAAGVGRKETYIGKLGHEYLRLAREFYKDELAQQARAVA